MDDSAYKHYEVLVRQPLLGPHREPWVGEGMAKLPKAETDERVAPTCPPLIVQAGLKLIIIMCKGQTSSTNTDIKWWPRDIVGERVSWLDQPGSTTPFPAVPDS